MGTQTRRASAKRATLWGRAGLSLGLLMAVGLGLGGCVGAPSNDRDWYPYLANTTQVERSGDAVIVSPVTDWRYDADGPVAQCYRDETFSEDALRDVWFVIEPRPGSNLVAHTFLMFEFDGDRLVGLTIEARREADETYSAIRGIFNAYELSYVWGSARDLLTRRVVFLDHEVFVYPLRLSEEQKQTLLTSLVARTEELEQNPRFYNTLWSNCTNELAKAVGMDWRPAFILTGSSDDLLFRRGVIPGDDFEEARENANVTGLVRDLNEAEGNVDGEADDFDARLLEELRRRFADIPGARPGAAPGDVPGAVAGAAPADPAATP